jgi:hypothetical protein
MKHGAKDYTGKRFGRLIATKRLTKADNKLGATAYECKCDCGKEVLVTSCRLITGTTKSCGCYNKERLRQTRSKDLIGQRFNRLLAIERIARPIKGVGYICLCDCGKITQPIGTGSLTSGNTKSCGCYNLEKIIERNRDPLLILKRVTNCSDSYKEVHWSTKEILMCKGRWERNVVQYLNSNQIEYVWQVPFYLSNGATYIIDFYDIKRNTYVEIKGRWRDDGKIKYDLFQKDNPALKTEVWNSSVLKSFGIPTREIKK